MLYTEQLISDVYRHAMSSRVSSEVFTSDLLTTKQDFCRIVVGALSSCPPLSVQEKYPIPRRLLRLFCDALVNKAKVQRG